LLIIYSPKLAPKNKILWSTCLSIAQSREIKGKKTVFITFKREPELCEEIPFVDLTKLENVT
jgi:hypothetical protein